MRKEQSHKSYRPITVLTFRLNYLVHELQPLGYHLVNVILHAAVTLLYHQLCNKLLSALPAAGAALLFAVHPVHTEAVTGVVGRAELLASVFFLLVFLHYGKMTRQSGSIRWRSMMMVCMLVSLAMLSKEQGITVIAVCVVHDVFVAQCLSLRDLASMLNTAGKIGAPSWVKRSVILLFAGLALMMIRLRVMGSQLPVFTKYDNPAAAAPSPSRQLTFNYLLSVNSLLLMLPSNLCCDWTMNTVPLVTSLADSRNRDVYGIFGNKSFKQNKKKPKGEISTRGVVCHKRSFFTLPFYYCSLTIYLDNFTYTHYTYNFHKLMIPKFH